MPLLVLLGTALAGPARAAVPTPGEMFIVSGRYIGDGTNNRSIGGLGFQPEVVLVKGPDGTPTVLRTSTMSNNSSKLLGVPDPTRGWIKSFYADGFVVANDPEVNQPEAVYDWVAFVTAPNRMVVGSYVGNGQNRRRVALPFRPDHVIVFSERSEHAVQRFRDQVGDVSFTLAGGSPTANWIESLDAAGFTVGDAAEVNRDLTEYHYIAWKRTAGRIEAGSYTGNGTDDRAILDPAMPPFITLLAGEGTGIGAVLRPASVVGDGTFPAGPGVAFEDGIQAVLPDGFEVGADARVNGAGTGYYWIALQNSEGFDLSLRTSARPTTAFPGDTIAFDVLVTNHGPDRGDGIEVIDPVPQGITLLDAVADAGIYTPATGIWAIDRLESAETAMLRLRAVVTMEILGRTITNRAAITGMTGPDIFDGNNADSVRVRIPGADLALTLATDDRTPTEGVDFNITLGIVNQGPDEASGVNVSVILPAGLTFISSSTSRSAYDPGTGAWPLGTLAVGGFSTLRLVVRPAPGAAGSTADVTASVAAAEPQDPDSSNNVVPLALAVLPPIARVVTGSYIGDATPGRAVTGLGFQPDLVIVRGSGATHAVVRSRTMSGDAAKELGINTPLLPGRITGLDADGFAVGADPSVNAVGTTYHWTAFLEGPGQMRVGTYVGDGQDNRSIGGVGFQSDYAMVWSAEAKPALQKFAFQTGEASLPFQASNEQADRIQAFEMDGFQIGANTDLNALGVVHHYAAWNAVAGLSGAGGYAGSADDDRAVDDLKFRPHFMFLVRKEDGSPTVLRSLSVPGDQTLPVVATSPFANGIQALRPQGFEIGSDAAVNALTKNYFYFGVRSGTGADLAVAVAVDKPVPSEGDSIALLVSVTNHGPESATEIRVRDVVPAGLTYRYAVAEQGAYDAATGEWTVGALASGAAATLALRSTVNSGTAGSTITNLATITASAPADLVVGNDADTLAFVVQMADLQVMMSVDDATPTEGESVFLVPRVTNLGPHPASGVVVRAALPAGFAYQRHAADQGTYVPATGIWTIGSIAPGDTATLGLQAAVTASAGTVISTPVLVDTRDQIDPIVANDIAVATVHVQRSEMRVVTGSYVGDGSPSRAIAGLGFQPDLVILRGTGPTHTLVRAKTMFGDAAKQLGANTPFLADRIRSLDPDGFTVGSAASVNAAGVTYHWTAFLEAPGQMRVGSYVGNAQDKRSIGGVGFQPGYMMLWSAGGKPAYQRFAGEVGDASLPFQSGGEQADRIQRFEADGFQIGGHGDVNANGVVHHYVAWDGAAAHVGTGLYLGNGKDNRPITAVGFRPRAVVLKRLDNSVSLLRPSSAAGDLSLPADDTPVFSDGIQAMLADGFEVGGHQAVNATDKVILWAAFRDVPSVDLDVAVAVSDSVPNEGDDVTYRIRVRNLGPENATGVVVGNALPAGLEYRTHIPSRGIYAPATGLWTVGAIANGDSTTLDVVARVGPATAGAVLSHRAFVSSLDQTDSNAPNDQGEALVRVQMADLAIRMTADQLSPLEGEIVTFTIAVDNRGPDPATNVAVTDLLPAGLLFQAATPEPGSYAPATGIWNVGSLAVGDTARMSLETLVLTGMAGATLINIARITEADQSDPVPASRADTTEIFVSHGPGILFTADQVSTGVLPGASAASLMRLTVRNSTNEPRVLRRVTFTNRTTGPGSITQRDQELGTLSLYVDADGGGFDPETDTMIRRAVAIGGLIVMDSLGIAVGAGSLNQFHLVADVPVSARDGDSLDVSIEAPSDVAFDLAITPLNTWPVSPPPRRPVNGMSVAQLSARPVGVVALQGASRVPALDVTVPANGYEPDVLEALHLTNLGDAAQGTDVSKVELWGDGGNRLFDGGVGDDFVIGAATWADSTWSLTGLSIPVPLGGRQIFATVNVTDTALPGRTIALALTPGAVPGVVVSSGNDGPVDLPLSGPDALVIEPGPSALAVRAMPQAPRILNPGEGGVEVLAFEIANTSAYPETLTTVSLSNATTGPGTTAQRDAEWLPVSLTVDGAAVGTAEFEGGRAVFPDLGVVVAPAGTASLRFTSGASLRARDGDLLDVRLDGPTDLDFSREVQIDGAWPIHPSGSYAVDGMVTAQIGVGNATSSELLTGSTRSLALELLLPPNGYQPDTLKFLLVENHGNADPDDDLVRLEAWRDGGDGVFDPSGPAADVRLGAMHYSGGAWVLSGISVPVPDSGLRVFVSCDIADDALEGNTVRLAVSSNPITGIGVASANDGPLDAPARNPQAMTITSVDRITLTAPSVAGGPAVPGDSAVVLLHLRTRNTYRDSARTLTRLVLTNRTTDFRGAGTAQLDAQLGRLSLHDGAANGPVLATAVFSAGEATFSGFARPIDPGEIRSLFVTAAVAANATDGDVIAAEVEDESDLGFAGSVSLSATFPLESGAAWTVNGMSARQIENHGAPALVLGPSEGPVPALDLGIPRNGYRDDVFEQIRVVNTGSALPADFADVRLWKDGGDGDFDAGAGDDTDLGSMTFFSGSWLGPVTSEPMGVGGLRLFVSITSSATPTDSASVRFQVPVNGITVSSGNDGPTDVPVVNADPLLLSTSGLLAAFALDDHMGVVGDSVTVRLVVRNTGALPITGVTPSALTFLPDGLLSVLDGPDPAALDLVVDGQGEFHWTLRSDVAGTARLKVTATGIELGSARVVRSLEVTSSEHHGLNQASNLNLFPVQSMPFSVHPGQQQVVPMSLTLTNPGGADASDILFRGVTLRLENEAGAGIVPADLIDRVVMNEGTSVYVDITSVPTSGSTITLAPAAPIRIRSGDALGQQVTLSLSLDVSASTTIPSFRLVVDEPGWIRAEDANNGAPVSVDLEAGLSYPVRSGLARLVSDADRLDVAGIPLAAGNVGRGQMAVPMLAFQLANPGPVGIGSDLRVSRFALRLVDGTGTPMVSPTDVIDHVRVMAGTNELMERVLTASDDTTIVISLPAVASIPVAAPLALTVLADLREDAAPGIVRMRLAPPGAFVARLASSGTTVPAVYATDPVEGGALNIQDRAETIVVGAMPAMPPTLFLGTPGVHAFDLVLTHPGPPEAGAVRCDSIVIRLRDQLFAPLVPAAFLDRVEVARDGVLMGATTDLPTGGGEFSVAVSGVLLNPGEIATLEVRFDVEAAAPTGTVQMLVAADGIVARDANVGTSAVPMPAAGFEFPLASGIAKLGTPARELVAGFRDAMPVIMPGSGPPPAVAAITVRNAAEAGEIRVDTLRVRAADASFGALAFGHAVGIIQAFVNDTLWAEQAAVPPGAAAGVLGGATPLTVPAGETVEIELRATARPDASVQAFRLGVAREDVGIIQPSSSLLAITLLAEEGQNFPFWTQAASVGGVSLESSYANFPNPFAAGRDATTFVYYLRTDARVTLTLWTARGEVVATLLDDAPRAAGLHQYDRWDGRNGNGRTVTNGAYIAELTIRFADGASTRLIRKVAVTR